jgi:hypothetical protein
MLLCKLVVLSEKEKDKAHLLLTMSTITSVLSHLPQTSEDIRRGASRNGTLNQPANAGTPSGPTLK